MQNTIVREFAGRPDVFTAVFQQGGAQGETREWLETFWSNIHLRGGILWDESGTVGGQVYGQPDTGLPFGRGFIIDRDGRIDRPYFGHQPQMAIARIYELLGVAGTPAAPVGITRLTLSSPNPLRRGGPVRFALARPGDVRLVLCDVQGRQVGRLASRWFAAGTHTIRWQPGDADGLTRGVHFLRLSTSVNGATTRQVLIAD